MAAKNLPAAACSTIPSSCLARFRRAGSIHCRARLPDQGTYFQLSVAFLVAMPLRMFHPIFMPFSINQRIVGAWQRRIYQRLHAQQSHLAALPVFVGQVQFIVGQGSQIRARISNSASHSWSPCPPFWYAGKTKTLPLEGSSGRVCLYKQPLDGCDSRESFDG